MGFWGAPEPLRDEQKVWEEVFGGLLALRNGLEIWKEVFGVLLILWE